MYGRTVDKINADRKMRNKIESMPSFIEDYYYYLKEKTYMTQRVYMNNVIRFLTHYGKGDINSVTREDLANIDDIAIQRYMADIEIMDGSVEMKADSKANIYSSINSFVTFLKRKGIVSSNPFDDGLITMPKYGENDIVYLEPYEYDIVKRNIMAGVGNAASIAKQKNWRYRDLLLFQIPIITGVRVTALTQISISDIDFEKKVINVIDKAKEKQLFLDDETIGMIYVWLEIREKLLDGVKCDFLFISNRKTKMTPMSVRNVISKYTENLDKHISPHKLRSTCGTNLYRATKDIYLVANVLGHNSPVTTKRYTKVDTQARENAATILANKMKEGRK